MAKSNNTAKTVDIRKTRAIAQHLNWIEEWHNSDNRFVVLSNRLHQTLDINRMLDLFAEEVQEVVSFESLSYRKSRSGGDFGYIQGSGGPHHCCYNLKLQGQELGSLRLDRRQRFSEDELMVLEQFIGILVQPLRNAWRYQDAVEAAMTDDLTGLGNRRAMESALERSTEMAHRYGQPLSLLLCDLDHFKRVNDTLGHTYGDEVLAQVGQLIADKIRTCDQGFRFGGEEFAILLPNTGNNCAHQVAERIRHSIAEHDPGDDSQKIPVTASIGIATLADRQSAGDLVATADDLLYSAKNQGRNRVITEENIPLSTG